uniref:Serine peptidase inhibitor Kazal type 9 n=1 Tax=Ursus americanus TaxID=9643 RepID=A0A452SIR5_URSAM
MKVTAFALLLALALTTIFSKYLSHNTTPVDCSRYKKLPPGKEGFCHEIYAPICGSDGKTYPNDCFFCYEVQRTDNKLKFVHFGKC